MKRIKFIKNCGKKTANKALNDLNTKKLRFELDGYAGDGEISHGACLQKYIGTYWFLFNLFLLYVVGVHIRVRGGGGGMYVPQHTCEGQKSTWRNWFLSIIWVLGWK